MLLAGLAALISCLRATIHPESVPPRRALRWSLLPPALGVVGALVGAGLVGYLWFVQGRLADEPVRMWTALGNTVLFGVFVAIVPALWALLLLQRRPASAA
jgi:hypothetical protein